MELLPIAPQTIQEKVKELMTIKANQHESYLHPKEELITTFLQKTVQFNMENAKGLRSGKKMAEELDGVFKETINKV